jgi:hypothetical protein
MKSRKMIRWEHVARMEAMKNSYKNFVGKPLGKTRRRIVFKWDIKEIGSSELFLFHKRKFPDHPSGCQLIM